MASNKKPVIKKPIKDELKDEITCSICLQIFEDPKVLPCGHTYCKHCLIDLAQQSNSGVISCPICRKNTPIPNGDVCSFPTVYRINRLKDVYVAASGPQEGGTSVCELHKAEEISVYCETCSKSFCKTCVIKEHNDHSCELIEDYRGNLLRRLDQKQYLKDELKEALDRLDSIKKEISDQEACIHREVEERTDMKKVNLQSNLHSKVTQITKCKLSKLQVQFDELNRVYSDMLGCIHTTENTIDNLENAEFASKMKDMESQLELCAKQAESATLTPVVHADTQFCVEQATTIQELHLCSGKIADPSHCKYPTEKLKNVEVGRKVSLLLSVCDSNGKECLEEQSVTSELHCLYDLSLSFPKVCCNSPNQYLVEFTPKIRGRHMLAIKVNGQHILGSPTPVFVHIAPEKLSADPVATISNLEHPVGLTCTNDGRIWVCERDTNCILEVDRRFRTVCVVATVGDEPNELVLDSNSNIYVTTRDDRLYKLDPSGAPLKVIGGHGKEKDKFNFGNGLGIFHHQLYVCDTNNHRIKVYDLDLKLLTVIGKRGTKRGQFKKPMDLAFSTDGKLFVSEEENSRIQEFDSEGRPIGFYQIEYPVGIHHWNGYLYVACAVGNHMSMLSTTSVLSSPRICVPFPEGVTVDEDGFVYVTADHKVINIY